MKLHFELFRLLPEWEKHIDEIRKILEEADEQTVLFVKTKIGEQALLTIYPEAKKKFPLIFVRGLK